MELLVELLKRVCSFAIIGLIVGVIISFILIDNTSTTIKFVILISGTIVGLIVSIFTLDSVMEKYYNDNN